VATKELSTLVAAVKAGGLVQTLSSAGHFTVFAPTNDAFAALGGDLSTLLQPENKALLAKVLTYHVVASAAVLASAIPAQPYLVTTVEGQQLTVQKVNGVVKVNNAKVLHADILASNGVVHVIDKVLLYPGFKLPSTMAPSTMAATCPPSHPYLKTDNSVEEGKLCWDSKQGSNSGASCTDWCLLDQFKDENPGGHLNNCPNNVCSSSS